MEPLKVEGNLKIAIRKTENGEIVYHKYPKDVEQDRERPTKKHSFEWNRDPHFESHDYHRCLHYHIGNVIDEAAQWMLRDEALKGYDIEVIIKPRET